MSRTIERGLATMGERDIIGFSEYAADRTIFNKDSEQVSALKAAIDAVLTEQEKRLLYIYADEGSLRKAALRIGCTKTPMAVAIAQIKRKVLEYYD